MSQTTTIEWTDATWNPVRGCTKISPGCANCYAERLAERFRGVPGSPYEQGFDLRLVPEPFFFKQWGGHNKSKAGRELDGRTHEAMPPITPRPVPPAAVRRELREFLRDCWR